MHAAHPNFTPKSPKISFCNINNNNTYKLQNWDLKVFSYSNNYKLSFKVLNS
jgi:hypothetical protein